MEPFLKWAGGKRWLTTRFGDFLPGTNDFNRYFEPFLGGGAVFFHLKPTVGRLSDINDELINAYVVIRDHWYDLMHLLNQYDTLHSKAFYYHIRSLEPTQSLQRAARFIYLNRTCWNGLYRVNQKGVFNVPIGTKSKVVIENDDFAIISNALRDIQLFSCDFEETIDEAGADDFIFVDPPYTVKHNLNGFVKYNEKIFSWDDQVRLRDAVVRATQRGALVLVLNANHESVRELYREVGIMTTLDRASVISGNANGRGIYSELLIKCW